MMMNWNHYLVLINKVVKVEYELVLRLVNCGINYGNYIIDIGW